MTHTRTVSINKALLAGPRGIKYTGKAFVLALRDNFPKCLPVAHGIRRLSRIVQLHSPLVAGDPADETASIARFASNQNASFKITFSRKGTVIYLSCNKKGEPNSSSNQEMFCLRSLEILCYMGSIHPSQGQTIHITIMDIRTLPTGAVKAWLIVTYQ